MAVATLSIAGAAWLWHWRTHPDVFPGHGNGMGTTLKGMTPRTVYVGVTYPYPGDGETVTITSARPRIALNTAEASFDFYVCTLALRGDYADSLGMAPPRHFNRRCPDPVPLTEGTTLDVGAEQPQQLVMAITLDRPGILRTQGVNLTYTHGWQHGTQAIAEHLRIRSR